MTLTATNSGGSNTKTKTSYITVDVAIPPPVANFSGTPDLGHGAADRQLHRHLDEQPDELVAGPSVTNPAPTLDGRRTRATRTQVGRAPYTRRRLTGRRNSWRSATRRDQDETTSPSEPSPPSRHRSPTSAAPRPPARRRSTVNFTDTSTNSPTSWSWTFGDNAALSTAQNPSHTYTTAGTYTVALTATNAGGSNTKTKTSYITVERRHPTSL